MLLTNLLAPVHSWQLAACDYALINSSMTWSKLPGPGLQPPVKDSDLFLTNQSPVFGPAANQRPDVSTSVCHRLDGLNTTG